MARYAVPALLALLLVAGCAGPSKLAQKSEAQLAGGRPWTAWQLATRALDRDPGNPQARNAAAAAASAIAADWQQRIHALADVDSVSAAEQVLEFAAFRASAVHYAVVSIPAEWSREEQMLRQSAARMQYGRGTTALDTQRPKQACLYFGDCERFVPGYRNAAVLAQKAQQKALTRVALLPFRASSGNAQFGREVAAAWRNALLPEIAPPVAQFTRIVGGDAIDQQMTVAQLGRLSREDAVRLGRKAGADRVVWGSIGGVNADTRLHLFTDVVSRRIVEKDGDDREVVRWVDVPIEIIARERTVTTDIEYEVVRTAGSVTLARQNSQRTASARVVWTSYMPDADPTTYVLVSEALRAANPARAKDIESRWRSVCGETTTLQQVLQARRATRSTARYQRDVLQRFIAGAAFVFLEDLPPAEDLAFVALSAGWEPLRADLLRLDPVDDVDLGVPMVATE